MSRLERLKQYAKPMTGPHGESSDKAIIDDWSARASENSRLGTRASNGEMKLHSTGKKMATRPTEMSPRTSRKIDRQMAGKDDLNNVGSSYMKSIRRDA